MIAKFHFARQMELRGVRVHNLKNLDLDIPLNRLVVLSGVSGSGKSSLAFETLFAEGQRRYIESFSIAARQHLERVERPDADRIAHVPVAIAIRSEHPRQNRLDVRSTVATVAELLDGLRLLFARVGRIICLHCHRDVRAHSAVDVVRAISALPAGTRCQIGFTSNELSAVRKLPARDSSQKKERQAGSRHHDDPLDTDPASTWLARGFTRAVWDGITHDLGTKPTWPDSGEVRLVVDRLVAGKTDSGRIMESAETALREGAGRCWLWVESDDSILNETEVVDGRHWQTQRFSRRLECTECGRVFLPLEPRLFSHLSSGACLSCRGSGRDASDASGMTKCPACDGTRFRDEARAVRIANVSIADLCQQSPSSVLTFLEDLNQTESAESFHRTELLRKDIARRLGVVVDLGLDYLTLNRAAETLSGGEMRRLMLAAVIGSRITGTLVVIDEPSAGLAESELPGLVAALRRVHSLRNSVVVVDHAPFVVSAADHVIELGPGAGPLGGEIVYQGKPLVESSLAGEVPGLSSGAREADSASDLPINDPPSALRENPLTLTLSPQGRGEGTGGSQRANDPASGNPSLSRVKKFPLRRLCVVAGPSGSGKTTLVTRVLYPAVCRRIGLDCPIAPEGKYELSGGEELIDAVLIDQSPLTRSSRSNPATWLDVFDEIRQTFAETADAKQRGFTAQQFSFNSAKGGRCRSCLGTGLLKQDMQFLPDVTLSCPECHGTRYRHEILEVKYRGRSIADVLAMSASEAASFFRSQPRVQSRFQLLKQNGLDYLVLGQPSETLSGGEAQRLKLAARLSAPNRGACLIVCDEPTAGLHPKDVGRLVTCFRELIANGHSIVVADNSPELLAAADDVIELDRPGERGVSAP